MTRNETIAQINAALEHLPDDRLDELAAVAAAWARPTVYSTLSESEKGVIDSAVDALDRGEGETWEAFKDGLRAKLTAAGV